MKAVETLAAIDAELVRTQDREHRKHLGASVIGKPCEREIWYGFRWSAREEFGGRMLRLFNRGQLEEDRFSALLRLIGCEVWPIDPATGKQWRVSDCDGHFGGSLDGVARGIPELPGIPFICEYKTHNQKSFTAIVNEGLCSAHPRHFTQTQVYMFKMGIGWGLYFAVNKNDDALHPELVQSNPNFAINAIDKAKRVIASPLPPRRINSSPGFYICKFCKFNAICHDGAMPEKNCRTCHFASPGPAGSWNCAKYACALPDEIQRTGCAEWLPNSGFGK